MIRYILGVVCGVVAGSVFNMAVIVVSWALYPLPEGTNTSDTEAMKPYIQSLPTTAFLIVLVAHAGGALVGGLIAALIGKRAPLLLGAIVGAFFLLGGIMNAMSLPAPLWFVVVDLVAYIPCGILGARLVARPIVSGTA